MLSIRRSSFAKLNLRLKVTGRDTRGFHTLSMLNYLVDLSDQLEVLAAEAEAQPVVQLVAVHPRVQLDANFRDIDKNLINRAASFLRELFDRQLSFTVNLEKNLPIGAGLGGGSSNAAAMLLAGWELGVKVLELDSNRAKQLFEQLPSIAQQLGSDVPFFFAQFSSACKFIWRMCNSLRFPT